MEARIHIAEPAPPYCSACFQAKPTMTHVDFGAAYDGPTVPALQGTIGVVGHTIDDLIICTDCLELGAALIGLEDAAKARTKIEQLETANDRLQTRIEALEGLNNALETTKKAREAIAGLGRPRRERAKAAV